MKLIVERKILAALRVRLGKIRQSNGFNTDAGVNLARGKVIDPDHDPLPALAIDDGDGAVLVNRQARHVLLWQWTPRIIGYRHITDDVNKGGLDQLLDLAEDIMNAIYETEPRPLGGLATDVVPVRRDLILPEAGSVVGVAAVTFDIDFAVDALEDISG